MKILISKIGQKLNDDDIIEVNLSIDTNKVNDRVMSVVNKSDVVIFISFTENDLINLQDKLDEL